MEATEDWAMVCMICGFSLSRLNLSAFLLLLFENMEVEWAFAVGHRLGDALEDRPEVAGVERDDVEGPLA